MAEKKEAILNIGKALMGVSFTTLAAIGSATGNIWLAGLAALPGAVLSSSETVGTQLARLRTSTSPGDGLLVLPVPAWWNSDRQAWEGVCSEIGHALPGLLHDMAQHLQNTPGVVTMQVVRQAFIDSLSEKYLTWAPTPAERRKIGEAVATPILEKLDRTLNPLIAKIQRETFLTDTHTTTANTTEMVDLLGKIHEEMRKQSVASAPTPSVETQFNPIQTSSSVQPQSGITTQSNSPAASPNTQETIAAILQRKIDNGYFDVFLCYNSEDRAEVRKIAEQLKAHGILPWFDEWELIPGLPWQRALEKQIKKIKTAAVFVGKAGIGPWQHMELDAFLRQFVKRHSPVIPVILATIPKDKKPKLPVFLEGMQWVDFRKEIPDPLGELIWGITGKRDLS